MSQDSQGNDAQQDGAPSAEPSTVWRVTLAWPVTSRVGRQERVDGLQQLLSTRAIVGLMGPGRPTRGGMVVDLVLPVSDTRVLTASPRGELVPGPVGDDFAWEVHRFTGAVVVNGDVAAGDFAVVASDGSLDDEALTVLLDEPLDAALLLGTVATGEVEEVADRLDVGGWISDGDRPVVAAVAPPVDPTSLVMPGREGVALALRERPGRVDLLLWEESEDTEPARPTRRRRAASRAPLVNTHLGARRRAVVLPDFMRPAGSAVSALLDRLDEDFAPLSGSDVAALGRLLPASRLRDLVAAVNEAPARGLDPEAGVLAPVEDGLLPGQEVPAEPEADPHAESRAVLAALGEDPALLGLFEGNPPAGRGARPLGGELRELATGRLPVVLPDAASSASADAGSAGSGAAGGGAPQDGTPDGTVADAGARGVSAPGGQAAPATTGPVRVGAPTEALPLPSQAGDADAKARLFPSGDAAGGFASQLHNPSDVGDTPSFDELLAGEPIPGDESAASSSAAGGPGKRAPGAAKAADKTPKPTPAAGTATASSDVTGSVVGTPRAGGWALPVLIVGAALLVAGVVGVLLASTLAGSGLDENAWRVIAGAVGVVGLAGVVAGAVRLRR